MSKLKTVAVAGTLLAALGLSTGALLMAYMNRPMPPAPHSLPAQKLDKVGGYLPDGAKGDRVVALTSAHQGGNASVEWVCGKKIGTLAEEHHGHWDSIGGAVAFNPKAGELRAVEMIFATASFQADQPQLARTLVLDEKWFDCAKHPNATFTATTFAKRDAAAEKAAAALPGKPIDGWTHLIQGTFSLNGVDRPLTVAAKVEFMGEAAKIEADFVLKRSEFGVEKHQNALTSLAGAVFVVDEDVRIGASITAAPDVAVLVDELGTLIRRQQEEIRKLQEQVKGSDDALKKLGGRVQDLEERPAGSATAATAVDAEKLPKSFEDAVPYNAFEADFRRQEKGKYVFDAKGAHVMDHFSFKATRVPFKMILVPGDPAKGIAPFYLGETEVGWNMFKLWSLWEDKDPDTCGTECQKDLRPSNAGPYLNDNRFMGYDGNPAMGMSRMAAEKFCAFLSAQTGRKYRLPTEAEWDLAYQLGGGDPADEAGKLAAAVCLENADDTLDDAFDQSAKIFTIRVRPPKSKAPNKLGIYDMLGNVSEWVKTKGGADGDGKNTFVRGGDFTTPVAQLTGAWRKESDNRKLVKGSWNESYPQDPNSKWWFKDHYQMGFRLVCEPANLPAQK